MSVACSDGPVAYRPIVEAGPSRDTMFGSANALSNEELERRVAKSNGRVFIGFKEPGNARGVSNAGRSSTSKRTIAEAITEIVRLGGEVQARWTAVPAVTAQITPGLVERIRQLPFVDYVEPVSTDARLLSQTTPWHISRVNAPEAWSFANGAGVKVLVIDTGKPTHDDVSGVIDAPTNLICHGQDNWGHGTAVIGVIKATNNSIGIVGVAPEVEVHSAKLMSTYGDTITFDRIACGLQHGIDIDADVINLSFEMLSFSQLIDDLLNAAHSNGSLLVAAAGNSAGIAYPAFNLNVMAVGGTTFTNAYTDWSYHGAKLELVAPADSLYLATDVGGVPLCPASPPYYMWCDGTSFSAPAVAAAAALVKSRKPSFTASQVRARLIATATDLGTSGFDNYFGHGLLNARLAVAPGTPTLSGSLDYSPYYPTPQAALSWNAVGGAPQSYKIYRKCRIAGGYSSPWELLDTVTGTSFVTWDYVESFAGGSPPAGSYMGYYVVANADVGDGMQSNYAYFNWDHEAEPGC
jgi:subtilisin family serine protease